MSSVHLRLNAGLVSILLATSIVSAQQAVLPAVAVKSAHRTAGDVQSMIRGVIVDGEQRPIKNAKLRLRNLDANEIEQVATANELGEFSFMARPGVPYVVEFADQTGRIVAVGDVVRSSAGEVASTLVVLPAQLPTLAGLFGGTALTVMTAATGIGLSIVDATLPKVSPTR